MKVCIILGTLLCSICSTSVSAATISLASTMDGNSYISENPGTGGYSRINLGDGTIGTAGYISNPNNPNYTNSGDRDGHYTLDGDPPGTDATPTPIGTGWDLFPREENFLVGSISYDDSTFTGVGVETFIISSLDMSEFWKNDPNRTASTPGSLPTVISDISDHALGLWMYNGDGAITFGALDALDTVTFTNGVLSSINLTVTTQFTASAWGIPIAWDGIFSINGADLSYIINDVSNTALGNFDLVADLNGRVNAVVPEPAVATLLALALGATITHRRRSRR